MNTSSIAPFGQFVRKRFFATLEKEFRVERVKNEDDGSSVVYFKTNKEQADRLVEQMQDIVEETLYDL